MVQGAHNWQAFNYGKEYHVVSGKSIAKEIEHSCLFLPENIIEGFTHVSTVEKAIELIGADCEEVMIIGGGKMYSSMLNKADRLYITRIHHEFEDMDTYFPEWKSEEWQEISNDHHSVDDRHQYAFDFLILDRIKSGN